MNKKTIWITGGSTGIGKALAIKFSSKGWNVAVSARRVELLNELCNQYENITAFPLDVTHKENCFEVFNEIKNKFLTFISFLLVTFGASVIGSLATINYKEPWYSLLNKPTFNPPDWVFGPVWTTLYLMMTLAIWLFWHSNNRNKNTVYVYLIHLVFNTTWSVVFFVFHNMVLALFILILLIGLIINLILRFKRVNVVSSYLMIPYLLWCSFALFLNINLIMIN